MTQKELKSACEIKKQIDRINKNLTDIHITGGVKGAPVNTPVQGGINVTMGQKAVELSDVINQLNLEMQEAQGKIMLWIEESKMPIVHELIIKYKYVDCLQWKEVSSRINYSVSHMRQIVKLYCER